MQVYPEVMVLLHHPSRANNIHTRIRLHHMVDQICMIRSIKCVTLRQWMTALLRQVVHIIVVRLHLELVVLLETMVQAPVVLLCTTVTAVIFARDLTLHSTTDKARTEVVRRTIVVIFLPKAFVVVIIIGAITMTTDFHVTAVLLVATIMVVHPVITDVRLRVADPHHGALHITHLTTAVDIAPYHQEALTNAAEPICFLDVKDAIYLCDAHALSCLQFCICAFKLVKMGTR